VRGDDVEVRIGERVGGEIGKIEREASESQAGYHQTLRAQKEEATFPRPFPRGRLSPSHTQLREVRTQNRLQQAGLQGFRTSP
jgi:hypothetical protein